MTANVPTAPAKSAPEKRKGRNESLWRLFHEMLRVRVIERRIAERYSEQEMRCPVHLSIGQEAVAVGVCAHLKKSDKVMSAHRSHGHYLAKGGNVHSMVAELYGRKAGCCGGRGGSMHLMDQAAGFWGAVPIVGSTLPIALGLALADKRLGRDLRTAAHCGPGQDDHLGYRHEAEIKRWAQRDPILLAQNRLEALDPRLKGEIAAAEKRYSEEIDQIIEAVRSSPMPDPATLMEGVFAP